MKNFFKKNIQRFSYFKKNIRLTKNFHITLAMLVSALLIIVIIIQASFSYAYFNKIALDTYYYFTLGNLDKTIKESETHFSSIKNLIIQLAYNNDVNRLLFKETPSNSDVFKAVQNFKNYGSFLPNILDISIYNGQTNTLYSTSDKSNVNDLYSNLPLEKIFNNAPYNTDVYIRSVLDSPKIYTNTASVNYIVTYTFKIDSQNADTLFIDCNYNFLNDLFLEFQLHQKGILYVVNENNSIVYSGSETLAPNDILSDKQLSLDEIPSGYQFISYNNEKYMLISKFSSVLGYKFIALIPSKTIALSNILQGNIVILYTTLVLILLSIIISAIFANRMRSPIEKIVGQLATYESYSKKLNILNREKTLKDYLNNPNADQNTINNAFKELSRFLDCNHHLCLIKLEIDNYKAFCKEYNLKDRELIKYGISNICDEIFKKRYKTEILNDTPSGFCIIISGIADDYITALSHLLMDCNDSLTNYLNISFSAAISDSTDFVSLPEEYIKIKSLIRYRLVFGHNSIITSAMLAEENNETISTSTSYISRLIEDLNSNLFDKSREDLENIFEMFYSCSLENIRTVLFKMSIAIGEVVEKIESICHTSFNIDTTLIFGSIDEFETLDETKQILLQIINQLEEGKKQIDTNKHSDFATKVMELVNTNFSDINFSSDSVADFFELSNVYVCRLFKQHTGKSLSDVIFEKRLEYAVTLLENTNIPIKDVIVQSGFINNSYFTVLFKKRFGITPSVYRNNTNKI